MNTNTGDTYPSLHCHVKHAANQEAAVHMAQELVHPSKWHYSGKDGMEELLTRRAYRERNGVFGAQQRKGHYVVKFTPNSEGSELYVPQ